MTRTAVVEREQAPERRWACRARASVRPEQRKAPPGRLYRVLTWAGTGVGLVIAVPIAMVMVAVVAIPDLMVALYVFRWLVGVDSGTGGGTD